MEKMDCYHFSQKFAFVKKIVYHLWTHELATGNETLETIEGDDALYETKEYEVVLVKATAKGCFEVQGYREV